LFAGASAVDITPESAVWLDGMIRDRKSEGVHDRIFARALVLSAEEKTSGACAFVSVEVCGLSGGFTTRVRERASRITGIPPENMIIAATHTHSGPATIGFFNPAEPGYTDRLADGIVQSVESAAAGRRKVLVGYGAGREDTISHYRRLLADDGRVVMNWEPFPPERIVGPLGETDPEVGVLRVVEERDPEKNVCILFNHAGHPNIMSGENLLVSGDYPGLAMKILEEEYGCTAVFLNGAQGTMDIDGLKDRDWEGVERAGSALASAVSEAAGNVRLFRELPLRTGHTEYRLKRRTVTESELARAEEVLARTGGEVKPAADGVGEDYMALLLKRLYGLRDEEMAVEQTCIAVGDCAFVGFPGELFTEIGMEIKRRSPFGHTYVVGLANGEIGYVPTDRAVREGGYAVETREVGDGAGAVVLAGSLKLLEKVYYS